MTTYSIKMPDMSRNMALAGKTVSSRGMNVTYDENGYAVKAANYTHQLYEGTRKSICAPSKEAVLAGDSRAGYDGPDEDRMHFSDREFAQAVELRGKVAAGQMSAAEANERLEEIRRLYGYSLGASGSQYAAITLPEERPDEVARAQAKAAVAQVASAQAASVQSAVPQDTDGESGTEQLRESFQAQLREQQQNRTLYSELEELRVKDMIRVNGKEKVADVLLELMGEDEDD